MADDKKKGGGGLSSKLLGMRFMQRAAEKRKLEETADTPTDAAKNAATEEAAQVPRGEPLGPVILPGYARRRGVTRGVQGNAVGQNTCPEFRDTSWQPQGSLGKYCTLPCCSPRRRGAW